MNVIEDGKGTGYKAQVDSSNRLKVFSVGTSVASQEAKESGGAFVIPSGFLSLTTTGSFNGIFYIKNTSTTKDLYIGKIRTCGNADGSVQVKLVRNPTAGTLISDANDATQLTANFGRNDVFEGDAFVASGDGKTVTDGTDYSQFIQKTTGHSIQDYEGAIIIPNGSSIALVAKPSVAMTFCTELQCWFRGI